MTEQLKQDIATLVTFLFQNAPLEDTAEFISALEAAVNNGSEITTDSAIVAAFGVAAGIAQATPNENDEQFIMDLQELYVNLKDTDTGIIQDLKSFFAARKAAKNK